MMMKIIKLLIIATISPIILGANGCDTQRLKPLIGYWDLTLHCAGDESREETENLYFTDVMLSEDPEREMMVAYGEETKEVDGIEGLVIYTAGLLKDVPELGAFFYNDPKNYQYYATMQLGYMIFNFNLISANRMEGAFVAMSPYDGCTMGSFEGTKR